MKYYSLEKDKRRATPTATRCVCPCSSAFILDFAVCAVSMIEMEPFRLRLMFEDSILNDSQESDGLKRSWVLVEPEHLTISDFVSYLLHTFNLWDSCPHGIFLSAEGFALPHFVSIAILNNNDLVCVKRKGSKLSLEEKFERKLPFIPRMPLSGIEDFEKESGDYQSESEEEDEDDFQIDSLDEDNLPNGDASIKKRKASKQLKNSKKKSKCTKIDSASSQKEHSDSYLQNGCCQKKPPNCKQDQVHNAGCSNTENWEGVICLSSEPDSAVKVPASRSTRRRKTQKQRWRIGEQLHKKKTQVEHLNDEDRLKILDQDSESGDEVVPVVVRPGHIRFTAPEKEKKLQQDQGIFNCCGITNNKKGKKWGKKKQSPSKWNADKAPYQNQPTSRWKEFRTTQEKQPDSKWNEHRSPQEKQYANTWGENRSTREWNSGSKWNNRGRSWTAKKTLPKDPSTEYEKLIPLTDFPLEGDIIAYRLLDVPSPFCPVLTSYRVGKVSLSSPESNTVVLVPVPEYPFEFKKATDNTSDELVDACRYTEDGTLEIDFPSLVDVRVVNRGWKPNSISGWSENGMSNKWTETSTWAPASGSGWGSTSGSGWGNETSGSSKDPQMAFASTSENGNKDVWEEISAEMNARKAQLLAEDNWNKRKPVNYTWSYRKLTTRARR